MKMTTSLPAMGATDAELGILPAENPDLSNVPGVSQNIVLHLSPALGSQPLISSFWSIQLHFPQVLFQHIAACDVFLFSGRVLFGTLAPTVQTSVLLLCFPLSKLPCCSCVCTVFHVRYIFTHGRNFRSATVTEFSWCAMFGTSEVTVQTSLLCFQTVTFGTFLPIIRLPYCY